MTREIKFRTWLKKENRMIDPVIGLDFSTPYPAAQWFENVNDVLSNNVSDCFMDDCELMQYTGLKDKNGKEIYEGDIIRCTDGADEMNELNSDTGIGAVEYWELGAFWNVSVIENSLGELGMNGYVEVIGNIYENADLLKG